MVKKFVRKIGVLSLGKITGVIYAVMGLIFGVIITLTSLTVGSMMYSQGAGGMLFGAWAIIALPIFYGVLGFIGGVITALIFNAVTGAIGGLELEIE
jgi:Flp pilus assembly protein TadB